MPSIEGTPLTAKEVLKAEINALIDAFDPSENCMVMAFQEKMSDGDYRYAFMASPLTDEKCCIISVEKFQILPTIIIKGKEQDINNTIQRVISNIAFQ